ncbi:MAG: hypothetical protein JNJ90_05030 [Saprospiraceae bacterium]|nr:hypothetical protein [Saprospiraceae bacterium]
MSTLSIRLDDDIVKKFMQASESEKARWEEAFNLWWRVYFITDPKQKLDAVTDYFRKKAQERGLTQEMLDEILADEAE